MNKNYLQLIIASLSFVSSISLAAIPVGCLIEPERIAEVGSQVIGVADKVLVERGDTVKKGQIIATLRSEIEQANVSAATTRSKLVAEVKTAEANLELAKITEKRSVSLVDQKFISLQALDKSHAETMVAIHRLTFAKEQLNIADNELTVARAQLNLRAIRAPFDGIVADRYIWPGERVEEKPLFRIVKTNPLRVEMVAPVALFGSIHKDDFVTITPELPNLQQLEAKVVLVDKIIDGASNTFRIRAEIDNPNFEIPSGLRCKTSFNNANEEIAKTDKKPAEIINPATSPINPVANPIKPTAQKALSKSNIKSANKPVSPTPPHLVSDKKIVAAKQSDIKPIKFIRESPPTYKYY